MLGTRITNLRKSKGLTQKELAEKVGLSRSALSLYELEKREPDIDTVKKIAAYFSISIDYLLGNTEDNTSIKSILGYKGDDEDAISFPHKLANQIDYNGTRIQDLAHGIGVSEEKILDWLSEKDNSYTEYYQELSNFFEVQIRYWTSPHALSPGIEPTVNEYILILLYRNYQQTGVLSDSYGSLENYFPGLIVSEDKEEAKLLSAFRQLNEDSRIIALSKLLELSREEALVAAKEERYIDSQGKSLPSNGTGGGMKVG